MSNILTVDEVAKELRVSVQSVRELIKRGELKAKLVGREYRIQSIELDRYIGSYDTKRSTR